MKSTNKQDRIKVGQCFTSVLPRIDLGVSVMMQLKLLKTLEAFKTDVLDKLGSFGKKPGASEYVSKAYISSRVDERDAKQISLEEGFCFIHLATTNREN